MVGLFASAPTTWFAKSVPNLVIAKKDPTEMPGQVLDHLYRQAAGQPVDETGVPSDFSEIQVGAVMPAIHQQSLVAMGEASRAPPLAGQSALYLFPPLCRVRR